MSGRHPTSSIPSPEYSRRLWCRCEARPPRGRPGDDCPGERSQAAAQRSRHEQGMTGLSSAEHGPKTQAIGGFQRARETTAERLLGARADLEPQVQQPLISRHGRGPNPANCSHFCSHLATPEPINPVRTGACKPTTASLLSSRSLVRIQQGAFQSGPDCSAKRPCRNRLSG